MNALETVPEMPDIAFARSRSALRLQALRCHKPGPVPEDDEDDEEDDDRGSSGGNIDPDDDEGDFDDDDEDEDETLWTCRRPSADPVGANSFAPILVRMNPDLLLPTFAGSISRAR